MSDPRFTIRQEDIAKLNRIAEILELEAGEPALKGEQNEWADVQRVALIREVMHASWGRA